MKKTPIFVALALSPGNKALTTLPRGTHIVVERVSEEVYHFILIGDDARNSTSYFNLSKAELFHLLCIEDISNHHSVWEPLTDTVAEKLLCNPTTSIDDEVLKDLLEDALLCNGEHHKQWYLWKLVDMLEIDMADIDDDDIDKGIAP